MSNACCKRKRLLPGSPALLFLPILLLAASPIDEARLSILSAYNQSLDALRKGDADAALSIDTDDWTSITTGQTPRTKQELEPFIRRDIANLKPPAAWAATFQPTGTSTGIQIYEIILKDPSTAIVLCLVGNKSKNIWTGSHVRDTWIKTPAGWKRRMHEKLTVNERIADTP